MGGGPPVEFTPYTEDVDEGAGWMEVLASMGIEGVGPAPATAPWADD